MTEQVSQRKKLEDRDKLRAEEAANFLIRSCQNGIFYQNGELTYLIPVTYKLGYRVAPFKVN